MDFNQATIPCRNYEDSVSFYTALGLRLIVDSPPRYARFESSSGSTFSIHEVATSQARTDVTIYFEVDDVDATVKQLQAAGIEFSSEPVDQTWLWREAYVEDPAGNRICIYTAGENRRFPPWRVAGEPGST